MTTTQTQHPDLFPATLLVNLDHGRIFTTSRKVAEHFGKSHKNVLRDIATLLDEISRLNFEPRDSVGLRNFAQSTYTDQRPVVEGTQGGLNRAAIAALLGKSCASVSYHRNAARRLGLLERKGGA